MKRKRKMPAHIVLPNGMWRFVSGKSRTVKRARRVKHRKARRLYTMAKRRYSRRRSGGGGSRGIMGGIIKPKGLIAAIILGAGAATLAEKFVPQVIPYQNAAVGFAVGGVGGAVGALARDMLKGGIGTTASGGNY
jgi:hypothetical protein